ncbi:MAG: hypothetical protein KGL39_46030 [Patescibacteria group bacterium]|nr:hypothetical protein [Patescibacteria group bacterium]
MAAKKKKGRPSEYTKATANLLCERIADGESLRAICREDGMPGKSTVFEWLAAHQDFADHYARARETQADSLADEIIDIADNSSLDANDKRVRIDTRKWLAGKLRPKKYGDKLELSGDRENPLAVAVEVGKTLDAKLDQLIGRKAEGD